MCDPAAMIFVVGKNLFPTRGGSRCDACREPLVKGQRVYVLTHLASPWKAEDDEYQDYGNYTWHVDCDQGSLAADGAVAA